MLSGDAYHFLYSRDPLGGLLDTHAPDSPDPELSQRFLELHGGSLFDDEIPNLVVDWNDFEDTGLARVSASLTVLAALRCYPLTLGVEWKPNLLQDGFCQRGRFGAVHAHFSHQSLNDDPR